MPEQEMQPRQVAYKVRIGELLRGEYIEQEGWQPNYVKVGDKQISRSNIIASVIDKEIGDNLGSLTIDDGSGNIQIRAFKEESSKLNDINVGDVIISIGRPRRSGNQMFISFEIVKKIDPLWGKVRQKELGEVVLANNVQEGNNSQEVKVEEVKEEPVNDLIEKKKKVLELIRNLDKGEGAGVDGVIMNSGLDSKEADEIIQELVKAGEIYENVAGKVKML
tara:strand:+ start:636 stop:1298 length:663 start_codon:yes stop_codon:yes gene_type:complete